MSRARPALKRRFAGLSLVALLAISGPFGAARADPLTIPVRTRMIDHFKVGSTETRFGQLEFVGGLELTSSNDTLGAMSSIVIGPDRSSFLGVMDTGEWYWGRIERDEGGTPVGIADFSVATLLTGHGDVAKAKWLVDAEGLAMRGDQVLVSFERDARVDIYPADDPSATGPVGSLPILIPAGELRTNRGLEAIATAPVDSPLAGAAVIVSERSLNPEGDIFAAVLEGPRKGVFFVRRHAPFDVTDAAFLPDGDLLLLERRFSIAGGLGMRIRRINGAAIRPGETVGGDVLMDVDFGHQIDNMEGLDAAVGADGQIYLTLVSDDNHSMLQRNLMLEFRLVGGLEE